MLSRSSSEKDSGGSCDGRHERTGSSAVTVACLWKALAFSRQSSPRISFAADQLINDMHALRRGENVTFVQHGGQCNMVDDVYVQG